MSRTKVERDDPAEPFRWLRANGHSLGALTGQDGRVLLALAACWQAYAGADEEGRRAVWAGAVALFGAMQPKVMYLGIELVAWAMDWSDRDRLREQMRMYVAPDKQAFLEAP